MKKIIGFLFLIFLGFESHAQTFTTNPAKIADSTFTNSNTGNFTISIAGVKGTVTFEYVITKTSGTVAGTIVLAGTLDGTHYVTLNTYTLTDTSANIGVTYNYNPYAKYRVTVATSGTQVSNYKIWALSR